LLNSNHSFKVAILGCQRSGTTLLKEVLHAGQIFMMDENWSLAYLHRERWHASGVWSSVSNGAYEQRLWDESVKAFTMLTYEGYYASKRDQRHLSWGVKAPGVNMARTAEYLASLFPELRFVILTRDPRDVFASMKASPRMLHNLPRDFYSGPINS